MKVRRYILAGAICIWGNIPGFAQAPAAPEEIWASATNETDFTAAWSAVAEAVEYRLDASTNPIFQSNDGVRTTIFRETMGTVSGTTTLANHEANNGFDNDGYTMSSGGAAGLADVRATSVSAGYSDPTGQVASGAGNIYFTASGERGFGISGIDSRGYASLRLSFGYRKENAGANMAFDLQYAPSSGAGWSALAVSNLPAATAPAGWYMVSNIVLSGTAVGKSNLYLRWVKTGAYAGRVDDVLLQGVVPVEDYLPGYCGRPVAGTSEMVTGLTAGATYYFRVRAVSATETGVFSSVASVTTVSNAPPGAPVFAAPEPQSAIVDVETIFAVSATGNPAPVLALAETGATGSHAFDETTGELRYTPAAADEGTQVFTFTASNSVGVATQAVPVTVTPPAPPVFAALGAQQATNGRALTFRVSAAGIPDPVLALQETTATAGSYAFAPASGQVNYTPPAADIGTNTFVFTASNFMEVATQAVSVVVAPRVSGTAATNLFISEYIEGSGNNKAVEIFNGTGAAVNLGAGDYDLRLYMNGATNSTTIDLTGSLADGEVFVVADPNANANIMAQADLLSSVLTFNGNDVVALAQNKTNLDVVGAIGSPADFAKDVTKVRKSAVCQGNALYDALEWDDFAVDTTDDLGGHTFVGGLGIRPVVNPIPPLSVGVGTNLEYTVTATEPDGDGLTFGCTSAADPATWSLDAATGLFRFTPVWAQAGTVRFDFTATDKDGPSSPVALMVTVSVAAGTPTVSFGALRMVGVEGEETLLTLPVVLSGAADATVQVAFAGTALAETDFTCATTTLVFSAGGASTGELVVSVLEDLLPEGPESARLTLVPVAGAISPGSAPAALFIRDNDAFSVVSANLSSGTGVYEVYGSRILEALGPDVVLIQEFRMPSGTTQRSWVDEHFGTDYFYFIESTAGDGSGLPNGVISRWPILAAGEWEDPWAGTRDFAWATIDLPGSRDLHAVSAHFRAESGYEPHRMAEAQLVTNAIAQAGWAWTDYVLVGGDLNLQTRTEAALQILEPAVTDARKPVDQAGFWSTSVNRNYPFDYLLPNRVLDSRHVPVVCHGYHFPDGMVFDTRMVWTQGVPPPALAGDSGAYNMQHMAVMKVYEFDDRRVPPRSFGAAPAGETQIEVSWTANAAGDEVVVVWNRDGHFSAPEGEAPAAGASFAGGTVLCKGGAGPQSHEGLEECGTYFYRCWSVADTNYSEGMTATATTALPEAPAGIRVAATNSADFTLAWSPNSRSAEYLLDVAMDPNFVVAEDAAGNYRVDFEGAGETKATYTGGTVVLSGMLWYMADALIGIEDSDWKNGARSARLRGSPTSQMALAADLTNGVGSLAFLYRRSGTDAQVAWRVEGSTNGGSGWMAIGPDFQAPDTDAVQTYSNAVQLAGQVRIRIRPATGELANRRLNIDDLVLTPYPGQTVGSFYVPGYSNRAVSGESQAVTGLTAGTPYYFRVRTVDGTCLGGFSATGSATTRMARTEQTIDFPAVGDQWTTNVVILAATASSGLPVHFEVTEGDATLANGAELSFGGTGEVAVAASQGGDEAWLAAPSVTNRFRVFEPSAPPVFEPLGMQHLAVGLSNVFAVAATGLPAPTLALQGTTASSGYAFEAGNGVLSYTPPLADAGVQTFTFTAVNRAGAATQEVGVTVALKIAGCATLPGQAGAAVRIASDPERTYVLQYTTNLTLSLPLWIPVDSEPGTGAELLLEDESAADVKRYYRIVVPEGIRK